MNTHDISADEARRLLKADRRAAARAAALVKAKAWLATRPDLRNREQWSHAAEYELVTPFGHFGLDELEGTR